MSATATVPPHHHPGSHPVPHAIGGAWHLLGTALRAVRVVGGAAFEVAVLGRVEVR